MRNIKLLLMIGLGLLNTQVLLAQVDTSQTIKKRLKTVNNAVLISPYYTAMIPVGELSKRFGFCNHIGLNISYKMNHNWLIGVESAYLFGSQVRENQILAPISTSDGLFITNDGGLSGIPLSMQGFDVKARIGKIFSFSKKHPDGGIVTSIAFGYIAHQINITVNERTFPQVDDTYRKGYDRLTTGPELSGYVGYLFLERKRFLSFSAGLEYGIGFTQNRREWNFDEMRKDDHQRYDMYIGFKLGWVIPIFTNKDNEEYYY